jgi:hypothetical protein
MVDALERAVPCPQIKIVEQRAARRQVLRHIAPLAPRAQDIHDAVDDFAKVDGTLATPALGRWDQRRDMRPFGVGEIARITQPVAIVFRPVIVRPHPWPLQNQATPLESHMIHPIQLLSGRTLTPKRQICRPSRTVCALVIDRGDRSRSTTPPQLKSHRRGSVPHAQWTIWSKLPQLGL